MGPRQTDVFRSAKNNNDFGELELRTFGNTIPSHMRNAEFLRPLDPQQRKVSLAKIHLEEVWGLHEDQIPAAIDNFVVRLRRTSRRPVTSPRHLPRCAAWAPGSCGKPEVVASGRLLKAEWRVLFSSIAPKHYANS